MATEKFARFEQFKVDVDQGIPARIAAFLHWAADIAPGRAISYPQLAKIILLLPKQPAEKDLKLKHIKGAVKRSKPILMDVYRRGLVSHPGFGVRASTGSEDTAKTQYQSDARRITSAVKSADRTRSIINVSDIKDSELKARVQKINGAVKMMISSDILNRLLPDGNSEE